MIKITCPHCGASGSIPSASKEIFFVAPCPQCGELFVQFREKVVAVNREILEQGTFEEKKQHVAEIITSFLDLIGPFPPAIRGEDGALPFLPTFEEEPECVQPERERSSKITKEDLSDFINIDLRLIDKKAYFERMFGKLD
jgi:hypothetical protein